MVRKQTVLVFLMLVLLLATACAPKVAPAAPAAPQAAAPIPVKPAWQDEWERTVEAGRKEGVVVVNATSTGPVLKKAVPLVKDKFGLRLEINTKRGAEVVASMLAERRAGIFWVDIMVAGTNTFFGEAEPAGLAGPLEPAIILPEILDPKNWYGGEVHWANPERSGLQLFFWPDVLLAVNTNLVKPGEIKSYQDLLDSKWKGKILMNDPTISGAGLKHFSVLGFHMLGLDYFRQLARQEPMIIRDQNLQLTWLSHGKYSILLFPNTAFMIQFIEAGAPVEGVLPKEGSYLNRGGGVVSLVNKAPHPSAAKVILNWMFSKEGLTLISRGMGYQSGRIDIPTECLNPMQIRKPGVKYFSGADTREWVARDAEFKKAAQEILGQYLR